MSFSLSSNFLFNARGITFKDGGGVTWSLDPNTNEITATAGAGGGGGFDTGTFTPTVLGGTTAGATTYVSQIGRYWHIAGYCFFHLRVRWSAVTGTGIFLIGGLPLTCLNTDNLDFPVEVYVNNDQGSIGDIPAAVVMQATTHIQVDKFTVGGTGSVNQTLPTAGDLFISGFYPV